MAVFPATGNTPVSSFIPEIWAAELLVPLSEALVIASHVCVNNDYEGEIGGPGDQVHVNSLNRPTVVDYTRNADVTAQLLDTDDQIIAIDHGKAFAFALDDVDRVQSTDGGDLIYKATEQSMQALRIAADSYVASKMLAGALTENKKTFTVGTDDVFDALVDYGVVLDNADVPLRGRFAVVRPEVKAAMLKHDKFIASSYGSGNPIQNGVIGSLAGFVIAVTPHLPTDVEMIVGSPVATTYGDNLVSIEAFRHHTKFAHVVRGLHVAGAKVIRPEALIIVSAAP